MNLKDKYNYRLRPMFSAILDFLIQVWQTITEAASEPLTNDPTIRQPKSVMYFLAGVVVTAFVLIVLCVGLFAVIWIWIRY